MELSEARKILEDESKYNDSLNKTSNELLKNKNLHWDEPYLSNFEIDIHRRTKVNQAIDIVLKALDNSISKDEVKNLIEEVSEQGNSKYIEQTYYYKDGIYVDKSGAIKLLRKLLGDD